ncbi:Na(+)-translocating NADH-quinone reductase subunit A [Rhodopirellula europaea]|jgi:Na+-transporting NADH:ubiquinone oxidoreductase subunit A|uniref:Na(+)-translocating NADH-quinone reductase subunit A n=2 Tax=Rhodopirellula europaea TaxID=1263866 RepID=M5SL94_9BACT|nr:Na(+)-translocating NADH-quinone reductase subunit A [Rhodopirellula europaea]EMI28517.1 Na(+)-translocating NADH-quinone reductase subunit A [Rhodopirellula europaea SH398]
MATTQSVTRIKKGLDLPITGCPEQHMEAGPAIRQVALLGDDYIGMKPTMLVSPGDRVVLGQPVFEDKKTPGVIYTAPASGTVADVVRGAKRKFEAIVIDVDNDSTETTTIDGIAGSDPISIAREKLVDGLVQIGLWSAFRTRPYGKVPTIESAPHSIFVTAIDTNPLAADPAVVLADRKDQFVIGLQALTRLTDGAVHLCQAEKASIPGGDVAGVQSASFAGPHPAGLPGTHIHHLDPVSLNKTVWYIGYQDVIAIGSFLQTGQLDTRRVISLAGPKVNQPRLIETRLGACIDELVDGEVDTSVKLRVISGSVLNGHIATAPHQFLGRYDNQVSVIEEGDHREFLGWQKPGFDKFSVSRIFASAMTPDRKFDFTSSTGGSERAMVPLGTYEKVMPMDILATQLLRALIVRDTDSAQQLGVLELEEEDLALCTFVCPGKYEYGSLIRENLTTIEREG